MTSDLVTTVTSNNDAPKPGDIVTYTVTVKNNGPADAPSPTVDFGRPPVLGNIEYSADGGQTWKPWVGQVTLADIPNGASSQVLIRGEIPVLVSGDMPHTITVTARSDNSDPNAANNTGAVTTTITPTADLHTTVTSDKPNPMPGDIVHYTVSVHNNGPSTAATPSISFSPPTHLTNVEYSIDGGLNYLPWTGSTKLSDLPNGGDAHVLIRGRISDSAVETIEMVFAATSPASDQNSANNTATVTAPIAGNTPAATGSCTVIFYDCGCQYTALTVPSGTPVAMPALPDKCGYIFVGWFTSCCDSGCLWNFASPVASNMELFSKWIPCR